MVSACAAAEACATAADDPTSGSITASIGHDPGNAMTNCSGDNRR
jgi:hypothetical protein